MDYEKFVENPRCCVNSFRSVFNWDFPAMKNCSHHRMNPLGVSNWYLGEYNLNPPKYLAIYWFILGYPMNMVLGKSLSIPVNISYQKYISASVTFMIGCCQIWIQLIKIYIYPRVQCSINSSVSCYGLSGFDIYCLCWWHLNHYLHSY